MAQIGIGWSIFDHCLCMKVRTTRVGFHNPIFDSVIFQGEEWQRVDFNAAGFWNCTFKGQMNDVMFRGDYRFPMQRQISGAPKLAPTQFDCLENYLRTIRPFFPGQEDWIVSNDDIVRFCGGDSGVVYQTLRECCIPSVA